MEHEKPKNSERPTSLTRPGRSARSAKSEKKVFKQMPLKRVLTWIGVSGGLLFTLSAVVCGVADARFQALLQVFPANAIADTGMILGLFIALLALYARLQIELDDIDYQPNL
jgi:hypothetical protein